MPNIRLLDFESVLRAAYATAFRPMYPLNLGSREPQRKAERDTARTSERERDTRTHRCERYTDSDTRQRKGQMMKGRDREKAEKGEGEIDRHSAITKARVVHVLSVYLCWKDYSSSARHVSWHMRISI